MKRLRLTAALAIGVALLAVAAASAQVQVPDVKDVVEIKIDAQKNFPGGPVALTLTKEEEIRPIIAWLKKNDWSRERSGDARVIRIAPVARVTVTAKDKSILTLTLAEKITVIGDRYWMIDVKGLADAVKQARGK